MNKISRIFFFFVHTKKSQIFYRFFSYFFRPFTFLLLSLKKIKRVKNLNFFIFNTYNSTNQDENLILQNQFSFLGKDSYSVDLNIWVNESLSSLWNFNLNYFNYLNDLIIYFKKNNNNSYLEKGIFYIDKWINASSRFNNILWAPYTISLRLINWVNFYSFLIDNELIKEIPKKVIDSIQRQNSFLKLNLEFDVRGNHLLENFKTIILTEYFLNKKSSVNTYTKKLNKELSYQLHTDGCHFEKSFSYHILILKGIIDLIDVIKFDFPSLITLYRYGLLMLDFYNNFKYSDSSYPLFNDSNFSMTDSILKQSLEFTKNYNIDNQNKPIKTLSTASNYYFINNDHFQISLDIGNLGPNYLLAHAHNDIFNFELLYNKKKFIVDTGVYQYQAGIKRTYSRSTAAHNTLQVSNFEQSDIWGSFRIGYRPTKFKKYITEKNNIKIFCGEYVYKNIYTHKRKFLISKSVFVVLDTVISQKNYNIKSFLHFMPNLEIYPENNHYKILNGNNILFLYYFSLNDLYTPSEDTIYVSNYYPKFGSEEKRKSIREQSNNNFIGYIFSPLKIISFQNNNNLIWLKFDNGFTEEMEYK